MKSAVINSVLECFIFFRLSTDTDTHREKERKRKKKRICTRYLRKVLSFTDS